MAAFEFEKNLSFLFPYLNAVAGDARLHSQPDLVRFVHDGVTCVLYPCRCIATPFEDREQAKDFVFKLMNYLTDILKKKDQIIPRYRQFKTLSVTDIIRLLPKTNCRDCGYATCIEFAAMTANQREQPSTCPHIGLPTEEKVTYPVHDKEGKPVSFITLDIDSSQKKKKETGPCMIREAEVSQKHPLTKRELEVVFLMGSGYTNRDISAQLNITPNTVKSHVIHIGFLLLAPAGFRSGFFYQFSVFTASALFFIRPYFNGTFTSRAWIFFRDDRQRMLKAGAF